MKTRMSARKKVAQNSTSAPVNSALIPSDFNTQPQAETISPPDSETVASFGHNLDNISLFASGTQSLRLPIQPKLAIGQPGDKYEQEADRVAKQVVNRINASVPLPVQRQSRTEQEEHLQMKPLADADGMAATQDLESSIQRAKGGGEPLAESLRSSMEGAFGADFSSVRVHRDAQSEQMNRSIQAKAFTTGQDIFFRQGAYEPFRREGQELLAHELTHVVQQSQEQISRQIAIQRAYEPATIINETTHMRKYEIDANTGEDRVKTGTFGKTGRNLAVNDEIVIDDTKIYNQQKTEGIINKTVTTVPWVNAIDVKPTDWDSATHLAGGNDGYIRQAKVRKKIYPYQEQSVFIPYKGNRDYDIYWHESIGEFVKVGESPANTNIWLIKPKQDTSKPYKKYNSNSHTLDNSPLTFPEKFEVSDEGYEFQGIAADGNWLVDKLGGGKYKYNPGTQQLNQAVFTDADNVVSMEHKQEKEFRKNLAKDSQLAPGNLTETRFNYRATPTSAPIIVYVRGNTGDAFYQKQREAIFKGLRKLSEQNIPLQNGLEIYISSSENVSEEAFHFGPGHIVIKPKMFANPDINETENDSGIKGGRPAMGGLLGVAHQVAPAEIVEDEEIADAIGSAVVVHEIGHVLHKLSDPTKFYKIQSGKLNDIDDTLANRLKSATKKISHYASDAKSPESQALEFVAEVFTGLVHGLKYSQEIIDLYKDLGGHETWTDESEVVEE